MVGGTPGRFNKYPWRVSKWLFGDGHEEMLGSFQMSRASYGKAQSNWRKLPWCRQGGLGVPKRQQEYPEEVLNPLFKACLRSLEIEIVGEVVVHLVKVLGQSLLTHRIS